MNRIDEACMSHRQLPLTCLTILIMLLFPSINAFTIYKTTVNYKMLYGNIRYVGGGCHGNFSRLQDAIDNGGDDDTICIYDDSVEKYFNKKYIRNFI